MFLATIGIVAHRGFLPAGTLISSYCQPPQSGYVTDYYNNYYYGAYEAVYILADGNGGTTSGTGINLYGCWVPAGFVYAATNSDIQYPGAYGYVTVGSSYDSTVADGAGGSVYSSGNSYNYACDEVYSSRPGTDGATGHPTTVRWHIDCLNNSYYVTEYINAGVILSSSCSASDTYDANGNLWYNVPRLTTLTADGNGGYTSETLYNTSECGYYPMGFAVAPNTSESLSLAYGDSGNNLQYWTYGTRVWHYTAQGDGSSLTEAVDTADYPSGYVFYSYFDVAGNQNVLYTFDGVNGYYITYMNV